MERTRRTPAPRASLIAKLALPFAIPIGLTFALMALVGESWPRGIAPGSGLKFAGLVATAVTAWVVWRLAASGEDDPRVRRSAALVAVATGLMGWPVWSVGVLPSINGAALGEEIRIRMDVVRTERTPVSKSPNFHHWVWLNGRGDAAAIRSGRYFISPQTFARLNSRPPGAIDVDFAPGLLGAQVVVRINPTRR